MDSPADSVLTQLRKGVLEYCVLACLRKQGLVESTWQESTSGPPRRYDQLTDHGTHALTAFADTWRPFSEDVTAMTEHRTDALGGEAEPTTEQVRAVLDELGSVEKIAEATTPASPALASSADEAPRGNWIAPALLATAIVSLVIPFLGGLLAIGCIVAAVVLLRGENPRRSLLRATIAVSIVTLVISAVLDVGALTLATFSVTSVNETGGPVVVTSTNP